MSDKDTVTTTLDDRPLPVPVRSQDSLLDRWITADPAEAMKRLESMVAMLAALRAASIRATYPSDWLIHTAVDRDGAVTRQVGYLQDCGAERAAKPWGIELGTPAIEKEDFPEDGTIAYHMSAEAWSKVTGERIERVDGSRWSGDPFFSRGRDEDDKVDPTDVRKAAYANLHGRAVRSLAGLNAVPLDVLVKGGIDPQQVVHIGYAQGARGGQSTGAAGVGTAEPVIGFGRSKGKKVSELEAQDLDWCIGAYQENVKDPNKAKYQKANQRILDALLREKEQRAQRASSDKAAGSAPAAEGQGADEPPAGSGKGALLGDVWARLQGAAGKKAIPLLKALSIELFGTEIASMSALTEEQLKKLAAIPDANLEAVLKGIK
jgi:hypothetical protein